MGSISDAILGTDVLKALAAHLERSGVSVEEIGRIAKLGGYQGLTKDEDGNAHIHDLFKWEISPKFADGPDWQPVDRGPAIKVNVVKQPDSPLAKTGWRTGIVWPDTQIGYYRGADGELIPTHDEQAIQVALQVVRAAAPSIAIRVGDDLDLPEFGRYRLTPAFAGTTAHAIDRNTVLGAEQRSASGPDCEWIYLAGNHEERLANYILDNAKAAYGLRPGRFASEPPTRWPVLSIPYLCRLDEVGIDYRPGFPAADVEITHGFRVVHGLHVNSGGSTAEKYLTREKMSVVYGHVHRMEFASRTWTENGRLRQIFAASPGCLARLDGAVPSGKGGVDLDGRPITGRHENWQQGIGVFHFHEGTGEVDYQNVAIRTDGDSRWAIYNGKVYEA